MNWLSKILLGPREFIFGRGDWIETFSGVQYYPCSPRVEDVRIVDIAHALANLCRFTGHCRGRYSVAEHSVHVSYCVPEELALEGLLHDGEEAYTNDIARPFKHSLFMWGYRIVARRNWIVVADKFGLPHNLHPETHYADDAVLLTERAALMYPTGRDWKSEVEPADIQIHCWEPEQAEKLFLDRFYELTRAVAAPAIKSRSPFHGMPVMRFG